MFHVEEGTGYAIATLESVFFDAALLAGYTPAAIHYSYTKKKEVKDPWSPIGLLESNRIKFNYAAFDDSETAHLEKYLRKHEIKTVVAFDLQVENRICRLLRRNGVRRIISYWGAPISGKNSGWKLLAKRIEVFLRRWKPDLYVFESQAMVESAVRGRGLPQGKVRRVSLGVETGRFGRALHSETYARTQLRIPDDRMIVFYSGHMEKRKGVDVIVRAAAYLVNEKRFGHFHFVFCGNVNKQEEAFWPLYKGTRAEEHITFAGYRTDIAALMGSCDVGVIASTGWDSFTMSSIEMAASGLPLVVSDLQGLAETVEPGITGYRFPPGDYRVLAEMLELLWRDPKLRKRLGAAGRARVETEFSREAQVRKLADILVDQGA